jgi:hypothetical protein
LSINCAVSVYLFIDLFGCLFSNWPRAAKHISKLN